ncbi:hypothetical protein M9435_003668 [Picochlorum sp. BPE23]|nr:hypothetical protein M9435_003668 [Picochlorum sp. BPE23]
MGLGARKHGLTLVAGSVQRPTRQQSLCRCCSGRMGPRLLSNQMARITSKMLVCRAVGMETSRKETSQRPLLSEEDCRKLTPLHAGNIYENPALPMIKTANDLAVGLKTNLEDGIVSSSEDERRNKYGANSVAKPEPPSFYKLILDALNEFTVLTLIGAGGVSLVLELWLAAKEGRDANVIESVSILAAVVVVVLVSAGNNWQKERQFRALEEVQSKSVVRAIRDGVEISLPVERVVVGDLLMLETGDILCADGVLVRGFNIRVDESHLTGESDEVAKEQCSSQALYSGSKLLSGVGFMLVTSVGSNSQSGMIADMISGENNGSQMALNLLDEETVLQKRLAAYASTIGIFGVAAAVTTTMIMSGKFTLDTFILGESTWHIDYLEQYLEFFITGVTILVVAIPEGLPLAVTISLAYSVMRMLDDNNLVRHLSAAETMGTATVICTDKTGTLTQNIMAITKVWLSGKEFMLKDIEQGEAGLATHASENQLSGFNTDIRHLLTEAIALNSTAKILKDSDGNITKSGNRTELALLGILPFLGSPMVFSMDYKKAQKDEYEAFVVGQQPFTSDRKRMASVVLMKYKDGSSKFRLYVKGAAEVILAKCTQTLHYDGTMMPLDEEAKEGILESMHGDGRRLLCVAYKDLDVDVPDDEVAMCKFTESPRTLFQPEEVDDFEHSLTAIFIAGISDPLRPEVRSAIESCKKGGISVRMFTGDNQVTAASIATDCGILTDDDLGPNAVLPSEEFIKRIKNSQDEVDRESFLENWRDIRVLARCSPSDKYTIVESLKRFTDEIVAVTGDGTNDAPALRIANVGFAMNDGTQIAKEAADIILVDNNFASTVSAALWGRNVYSNISKFLQFQLTVNLVALITAAGGAIASAESPLTTVQMLWVNLIMDSLASLALATGYPDISLLEQKPYKKDHNFVDINGPLPKHILGQAAFQLMVMAWLLGPGPDVLGIDRHIVGSGASVHHTLVFNSFVMMQLFNQLNSRQIEDSRSILENIQNETLFQYVLGCELIFQFIIIQYGGQVFSTVPLSPAEWSISLGFGAMSLLLREVIRRISPKD